MQYHKINKFRSATGSILQLLRNHLLIGLTIIGILLYLFPKTTPKVSGQGPPPPLATRIYAITADKTVTVFNLQTKTVGGFITLSEGGGDITALPNGTRVYVSEPNADRIAVIDTSNNSIVAEIPVQGAYDLAMNSSGTRLYAISGANVAVIDTSNNTVIAAISPFSNSIGIAVSPNGSRLYVGSYDGYISVVDTNTNSIIDTIPLDSGNQNAYRFIVSPDNTRIYLIRGELNEEPAVFRVINIPDKSILATIHTGQTPSDVKVKPDGTQVYVANEVSDTVSLIETTNLKLTNTVQVLDVPQGLAVDPAGSRLYVGSYEANTISSFVIPNSVNAGVTADPAVIIGGGHGGTGKIVAVQ